MKRTISIASLPKWLLCVPLVAQWLWLGLCYRSLTLPSTVNPDIENGGLAGESKLGYLRQIGKEFGPWVAPTYPVLSHCNVDEVRVEAGLGFPLIAKPDIGWCGYGVRRINNLDELLSYASAFPKDGIFLLQQFAAQPKEAGIFYVRQPGAARGKITAITLRHIPVVTGDGVHRIGSLIANFPKLKPGRMNMSGARLQSIPENGEIVQLTTVASIRIGARYEDASHLITAALEEVADSICRSMGKFHWGRFDVKFSTEAELGQGKFTIIEVNGAGSEAIHLWDPDIPILQAFRGVFAKQSALFSLAACMRHNGRRPVGILKLAKAYIRQQRLISHYPISN